MSEQIKKAAAIIKEGGVVIFPTDTAYALGGSYDDPEVEEKILKIKGRSQRRFTLAASGREQVEKFFALEECQKKIAEKFWPGPVSIVLDEKYAVRVPDADVARELARLAGRPLIATSANLSGRPARYDLEGLDELGGYDYAIDAGALPINPASAIVDCLKREIIRPGTKKQNEQIRAFFSSQ